MDEVPWNVKSANVGNVQIVVDTGSATLVFGSLGMQVFTGGVVATADGALRDFRDAAIIAGATSNRVLVVAADGSVHEVENLKALVPATDRLGLSGKAASWVVGVQGRAVFGLPTGLAIADGDKTGFFDLTPLTHVSAAGSRLAGVANDAANVRVYDVLTNTLVGFSVPGATAVAFDGHTPPRLVVAAGSTVYRENAKGELETFWTTPPAPVTSLSAADGRLWAVVGEELARIDDTSVSLTSGKKLAPTAGLVASGLGAWITGGPLRRLSLHAESPDEDNWNKSVQPVFARSCTPCHLPDGSAGTDLTTYERWDKKRPKIRTKVFGDGIEKATMPPVGYPLTDSDRAAIDVFTSASAGGAAGSAGAGGGG
jgi:mono/diheme cytochrome c family protein